jgi:hypothetical protein
MGICCLFLPGIRDEDKYLQLALLSFASVPDAGIFLAARTAYIQVELLKLKGNFKECIAVLNNAISNVNCTLIRNQQ